ncbi:MAG TPA: hypothetical protein PKW74_01710 [Ruminococcus bromii]|nr:hypothetical protein [Ruminococcus bromii]
MLYQQRCAKRTATNLAAFALVKYSCTFAKRTACCDDVVNNQYSLAFD